MTSRTLKTLGVALGALGSFVLLELIWLGLRVAAMTYSWRKPDEAQREGERFYYLALWGMLTDKPAFARKMLANARQMGFTDSARLSDQTLAPIST